MISNLKKVILILSNFLWMLFTLLLMLDFSTVLTKQWIAIGVNYLNIMMNAFVFVFIHKDNLSLSLLKEVN